MKLTPAGLDRARRLALESDEHLERVLARLGVVSENDIAEALATLLDIGLVTLKDYPDEPVLEDRFSRKFLREAQIIPLGERPGGLAVAMVDPLNDYAAQARGRRRGKIHSAPGDAAGRFRGGL